MKAGRGIRTAAVLMAGLVGAAVLAPGMAFAEDTPSVPVCGTGQVLNAAGTGCESAAGGSSSSESSSSGSSGTGSSSTGSSPDTSSPTTTSPSTETSTPTTGSGSGATPESGTTSPSTGTGATSSDAGTASGSTPATGGTTTGDSATGGSPAKNATPAVAIPAVATPPADTVASVSDAASALAGTDVTGGTIGDILGNLPTGNLTGLGTIPTLPASGTFDNAQDACLYLASKVNAPAGSEAALGDQFKTFCGGLPSTSTASLTDLITALTNLLKSLQATPASSSGNTNTTPIHTSWGYLPASFWDLDCADLTYDEAQWVLKADPSDPNHLDGDHDGIACERNYRDYHQVCDDYHGYPVGAVATGDSAPPVTPALGTALAGLALATVAGATAGRREDTGNAEADGDAGDDEGAEAGDLLMVGER